MTTCKHGLSTEEPCAICDYDQSNVMVKFWLCYIALILMIAGLAYLSSGAVEDLIIGWVVSR